MWRRFCRALDLGYLAEDPELADNAGRRDHRARITEVVAARLATRPAAEWLRLLGQVDVPVALVRTLSEVVEDEHVVTRGALMPVPGASDLLVTVHSPFRLASIPDPRNERFPDLGADTTAVLKELGYSDEEAVGFVETGVVGSRIRSMAKEAAS